MMLTFHIIIVLLVSASPVLANDYPSEEKLETLFTSSYQRFQLDQQRNSGHYQGQPGSIFDKIKPPLVVQMQGLVLKENQTPIVFINDQSTLSSFKLDNNISVSADKTSSEDLTVPLRAKQQFFKLKPGQQWNESSKQVSDNFQTKPLNSETKGDTNSVLSNIIN